MGTAADSPVETGVSTSADDASSTTEQVRGETLAADDRDQYEELDIGFSSVGEAAARRAALDVRAASGHTVSTRTERLLLQRARERQAAERHCRVEDQASRDRLRYGALAIIAVVVFAVLALRHHQEDVWRFAKWPIGTELALRDNGQPFGVVIDYDDRHNIRVGEFTPSYRVKLYPSGEQDWFTKQHIYELCMPSSRNVAGSNPG